jgi:hypothetical protein
MREEGYVRSAVSELAMNYRLRVLGRRRWGREEIDQLGQAVEDLSRLMGGPAAFGSALGKVPIWRTQRRTRMAAMALPFVGVVYFQGASWGDAAEFKWQTVHELAHIWDIRSLYGLSRGLLRATQGSYGAFKWQSPIPFEYKPGGRWLEGRPAPLNALEDWADSVATYVYPGHAQSARGSPRLISPGRWSYVRERMEVPRPYPAEWVAHFYVP